MTEKPRSRWLRRRSTETDAERGRREKIEAIPLSEDQRRMLERLEREDAQVVLPTPSPISLDEMMAAKHDDLRKQLREVEEEYSQKRGTTRGMLARHRRQKYVGGVKDGRRIYSCTVASTINALDALGLHPHETDDSLIDAIGGVSEFEGNGFLNVGKLLPYLRQRGVNAGPNVKLKDLFLIMDIGGVGLLGYGGHAKLISGYQVTDSGEIRVGINDPFIDTLETPRLRDVVEGIIASRDPYPQFLLMSRRLEPVPGRVRRHEE